MAAADPDPPQRRIPRGVWWALLALGAAVGMWSAGLEWRAPIDRVLAGVRAAGPLWYFGAMAVVPLPLAWFTVPAGEAFAAQLTLGGVIAAGMVAVAVQVSLTYWVARYGLRPAIARWVARRGHAVPRVTPDNALSVALLVRLTPGPPMVIGSCLLALAEVPFRLYLPVSCLVALPWVCAGVILGRGMLQGNFGLIAAGAGLMVAVVLAVRLWRRRPLP